MSLGAICFYIAVCVVSTVLFAATYVSPILGKEQMILRNTWRACIVAFSLAALLVAMDIRDAITVGAGFVSLSVVYAVRYFLAIDPHPVIPRQVILPIVTIGLGYATVVYALPWIFTEVKHGVAVKDALATLLVVISLVCTYTSPGRWFVRKTRLLRPYI